jgi:hypothetical protein
VAYLDTETTGLNGGAGTYVFAAAVARPIDCGLRLAQLFLPQPGLEAAFLHRLREELDAAIGLASFNGGSFDLPVLKTRWVMARMPGELARLPHVDLLTLVRALFRHRMESCTLRVVEERLLGYERDDPIAGALVPDAYFAYLHSGSSPMLEAVLEHNRLDVISLVHLHSRLLSRLEGGDAGMDASDWLALGRHRLRRGDRADGWHALRNAAGFAGRAPSNFAEDEAAATAGLLIARRLARRRTSVTGAERLLGWRWRSWRRPRAGFRTRQPPLKLAEPASAVRRSTSSGLRSTRKRPLLRYSVNALIRRSDQVQFHCAHESQRG